MSKILMAALLLVANNALARPVSWPGGWTIMQFNNFIESRAHLHYSTNAFNSYGLIIEDSYLTNSKYAGVQWNHLLKRRNTRYSQANVYFKTQLGMLRLNNSEDPAATIGIGADWETRRYFTSYEARYRTADNLKKYNFMHHARLGIAPYLAEYGSWHMWFMLHADHNPDSDDELTLTPMVRLFRSNYLFEAGFSENEDVMFNWIVRF